MYDGATTTADGLPIVAIVNGHSALVQQSAPELPEQAPAISSNVRVRIKPQQPIDVEVDFDLLRGEHLELIQRMQASAGDEQYKIMLQIIAIVTGQDMSHAPLRVITSILAELPKAISDFNNPN